MPKNTKRQLVTALLVGSWLMSLPLFGSKSHNMGIPAAIKALPRFVLKNFVDFCEPQSMVGMLVPLNDGRDYITPQVRQGL